MITKETVLVKTPAKVTPNAAAPEIIYDDFSTVSGYFNEENGNCDWKTENGMLRADVKDREALTYIHVFEQNVIVRARVRVNEYYSENAEFSLLGRYNADAAWVRLSYMKRAFMWGSVYREGLDFNPIRCRRDFGTPGPFAEVYKELELGTWHDIQMILNGRTMTVLLDGSYLYHVDEIEHLSPGRVGVRCRDMALDIDSFEVTLLSGQGTVIKNVKHTKLPDEKYREGGSVFEMKDGSLIYTHFSGDTFESRDNGTTWERREKWTDTHGYPNILRLRNGDFMKMIYRTEEDGTKWVMSQTSSDDGATWVDGGKLLRTPYRGNTTAGAGNMNDKLTQISNGRIFYCMNYEVQNKSEPVDGKYIVFCEFYYSDDNGKTWTKAETDSVKLPGNENQAWFGECKILECDDGSLRMYNSWNDHGCIVYSESLDGGNTWGPMIPMKEFVSTRASMQFVRDAYADNETTYYMVWVYCKTAGITPCNMPRSRLALAKSTNGKDWEFLGDLWRFEHRYMVFGTGSFAHVVDAFIKTTKDHVICGAGFCEYTLREHEKMGDFHNAQRQHIYSIPKADLKPVPLKPV